MDKTVLVTGGCGFIGSHLVESLLHAGWRVRIVDNLSSGTLKNVEPFKNEVEIIEGDIRDYNLLSQAVKGVDAVSHHAAQLEIFLGIASPEKDLEINCIGTLNVLRACRENAVTKLINASSACVYGQAQADIQDEEHPVFPNWEYGVSKLAAERYCQIYADTYGMSITSLRYGITYGPREWYRRALTIFIKRVLHKKPPVVFGSGDAVRDFVYVSDVADLHDAVLNAALPGHTILNAGTGIGTSVRDLAFAVCAADGSGMAPVFEDVKEGEFSKEVPDKRRNSSELARMVLDPSRAYSLVQWQPNTTLVEGIKREMAWARDHLCRWQRIYTTQW